MKIKRSLGERTFEKFNIILMCFLMVITLYPLWHVLMASFSDGGLLMAHTGPLFSPIGFSMEAYKQVFKNPMVLRGYLNTIFVVVVGVSLNILMTSIGAYFLSRKDVFWNKFVTLAIVFTMFFSGGLIPFYFTVRGLHLDNTLWALIIPVMINTFNLIIMRTAFSAVPQSLEESAKIDGAGHFTILFKLIIPLCMPTIAVMILYYGVAHWNAWFNAMIFLRNRELYPLQLILREILIQNSSVNSAISMGSGDDTVKAAEAIKYAIIIVATIPVLCIYPFLQKYFAKGVMIGAVKG